MRVLPGPRNPRGPTGVVSRPWTSLQRNLGARKRPNTQDTATKGFTDFAFTNRTPAFLCKEVWLGTAMQRNCDVKRPETRDSRKSLFLGIALLALRGLEVAASRVSMSAARFLRHRLYMTVRSQPKLRSGL